MVNQAATETETTLTDFYLTFGVQYSREPHPYWAGAHPDGWVQIHTKDESTARQLARRYFGQRWSMLYDNLNFNPVENKARYYPRGVIALITDDGAVSTDPEILPPSIHVTPSDPEYHGVDPSDVVGVRIDGHLKEDGDPDFYDARLFHRDCADEGRDLFRQINEEDGRVMAFELDWNQPAHCTVCETSLT